MRRTARARGGRRVRRLRGGVPPPIGRVGLTVFEYDRLDKREYFAAVPEAQRRIDRITSGVCDPVQRVQELVRAIAPSARIAVASEEEHGRYFAGLLRRIEHGTLVHVDFAPAEHPSRGVGRITSQVVWNVYLEVPRSDRGTIRIWQKQWTPDDDRYKISGSYGYRPEVVAGQPCAEVTPQVGMLVLINTRHFHQVTPAGGRRLAITASLGRLSDEQLIMWS